MNFLCLTPDSPHPESALEEQSALSSMNLARLVAGTHGLLATSRCSFLEVPDSSRLSCIVLENASS